MYHAAGGAVDAEYDEPREELQIPHDHVERPRVGDTEDLKAHSKHSKIRSSWGPFGLQKISIFLFF